MNYNTKQQTSSGDRRRRENARSRGFQLIPPANADYWQGMAQTCEVNLRKYMGDDAYEIYAATLDPNLTAMDRWCILSSKFVEEEIKAWHAEHDARFGQVHECTCPDDPNYNGTVCPACVNRQRQKFSNGVLPFGPEA